MDVKLYICTIYANDGKRIGIRIQDDIEAATKAGKSVAADFGSGCTYKVWECTEVKE